MLAVSMTLASGCNKLFDDAPLNQISEEPTWTNSMLLDEYVNMRVSHLVLQANFKLLGNCAHRLARSLNLATKRIDKASILVDPDIFAELGNSKDAYRQHISRAQGRGLPILCLHCLDISVVSSLLIL